MEESYMSIYGAVSRSMAEKNHEHSVVLSNVTVESAEILLGIWEIPLRTSDQRLGTLTEVPSYKFRSCMSNWMSISFFHNMSN
jgi:hypothetical protein